MGAVHRSADVAVAEGGHVACVEGLHVLLQWQPLSGGGS